MKFSLVFSQIFEKDSILDNRPEHHEKKISEKVINEKNGIILPVVLYAPHKHAKCVH